MRGALKGKTTVLVTHQVDFLHNVDRILVRFFSSRCYASFVLFLKLIWGVIQILLYLFDKGDEGRYDSPIREV